MLSPVGFGRLKAFDQRDMLHRMEAKTPIQLVPASGSKIWPYFAPVLDQGDKPQCVAYSWTQFLMAYPLRTPYYTLGNNFEQFLYDEAQRNDEWPGENYDGTSVRAGAKVLKSKGRLKEYVWGTTAAEARDYILTRGPAIAGTDWKLNMFWPDENDFLDVSGQVVGGHAYLLIGFSNKRNAFRMLNSWSSSWGNHGRAWIRFEDMDELIQDGGECCSAIEAHPVVNV